MPTRLDIAKSPHQVRVLLRTILLLGKLNQPLAKYGIQSGVLRSCLISGQFDQVLIRAKGDVLHEDSVHDPRAR